MTVRVKVLNGARLGRKLDAIPLDVRRAVGPAMARSALEVQGTARRNIQRGARSGRIYPRVRGRRGAPHQASAPGEFPKTDTGRLAGSIFADVDIEGLAAEVGTDVKYGQYLEFGTRKMAARPWLGRSFDQVKDRIRARITQAWREATRKNAGR